MFIALVSGANFINNLLENFLYGSALRSVSLISVWLCNSLAKKNNGSKAARKMLVKLTTGEQEQFIVYYTFDKQGYCHSNRDMESIS